MKYRYLLITSLATVLLLGAACDKKESNKNGSTNDIDYAPVVINMSGENVNDSGEDDDNTNSAINTNSNSNSNTNTSAIKGDAVSGTLSVSNPDNDRSLVSPFTVEGKSAADKVYVSVVSKTGVTIFTVPVTVRSGVFKANITFDFSNITVGTVKVFEKDAAGETTNSVSIVVTFDSQADDDDNANTNANNNANENMNSDDNENDNTNIGDSY